MLRIVGSSTEQKVLLSSAHTLWFSILKIVGNDAIRDIHPVSYITFSFGATLRDPIEVYKS